jgi:hypothetical protein
MRPSHPAFVATCALVSLAAVVSAAGAALYEYTDDELSGPEQPIQFSHAVHAGTLGIECLYCHSAAEKSQAASIPAVGTCMGCHQWVKQGASPGSVEEIAKLAEFYQKGESIPWNKVHNVPEYVQFKHFRHVNAGVECQECHGPVETMNRVWMTPDTVYRSAYLPAAKLEMGWCMDCHLERVTDSHGETRQRAADDCAACHF